MKEIDSPAGFEAALQVERAVIFLFFEWSRQAAQSKRLVRKWEKEMPSLEASHDFVVFELAPDPQPYTWKWINEASSGFQGTEHAAGSVFWLRRGSAVGFVPNAARAAEKTLSQMSHECFVLGKTGVSPGSILEVAGAHAFDAELLKILCCPETHQPLKPAAVPVLELLNQRIASAAVRNRGGHAVRDKVDGGLVRADGKYLYPMRQNIPVLLVDEAIPLEG